VGGASGALSTGRSGAGDGASGVPLGTVGAEAAGRGGAEAAGRDALATGVDPTAAAGSGGGMVPWPNRAGDAAGEDGSGKGADAAK